jgi:hypothetical protein
MPPEKLHSPKCLVYAGVLGGSYIRRLARQPFGNTSIAFLVHTRQDVEVYLNLRSI